MITFTKLRWTICLFLLVGLHEAAFMRAAFGQHTDPVVARVEMRFALKDKTVDIIEKGDLLTLLGEQDGLFIVMTHSGNKGLVDKVNVARLEEAVEVYDELIAANKKEGRLYTLRASAWLARGDEAKALADYDAAIANGYRQPHAYSSRGLFHASLGEFDKAVTDYTTAIKLGEAKDDAPFINRAAVYMSQKKFDQALADYTQALKINNRKPTTWHQRAVAYKIQGKMPESIKDFSAALKADPRYVPAIMGRGYVHFQLGDSHKAVEDFSAVIKLNPEAAEAYNNRGYNLQLLGEYKEALEDYNKAIDLVPKYALALQNKAWLLATADDAKIRDGKMAITAAETACKLNDYKLYTDLKALAAAYAEAGEFDKAVGWQEKAIALAAEPQKEEEQNVLKKYQAKEPYRVVALPKERE